MDSPTPPMLKRPDLPTHGEAETPRAGERPPTVPELSDGGGAAAVRPPSTVRIWRNEPQNRLDAPMPLPPEWATDALPVVPNYDLVEELGRGGMGVVYKARQLMLNRFVALKMILTSELDDADTLTRFRAEAEAVAGLQHPHIVQVFEVGDVGGRPFFSMEYVGGGTLAQKLLGKAQPPESAAVLVETLARTVQYAHDHGIVHRDLKPGNVLLAPGKPPSTVVKAIAPVTTVAGAGSSREPPPPTPILPELGQPKITDFGLAKSIGGSAAALNAAKSQRGLIVGTPQYMAPEQANGAGEDIGPACDIYSLGAVLYEMLTGQPPFHGTNAMDTLLQVRFLDPIPPRYWQPKVPRDLETVCLKCLQKEPRRRYPTADALADDLARYRSGLPIHARPTGVAERLWRNVQRAPVRFALATVVVLLLLGGQAHLAYLWRSSKADGDAATAARDAAGYRLQQGQERERLLERQLYAADIRLAAQLWQARQPRAAAATLHRAAPRAGRGWEWSYLHGVLHPELAALEAPGLRVRHIAASADGRWLAAAGATESDAGEIWLWDATALGQHPRTLRGHASAVTRLITLPDGKLASGGADGTVRLWDCFAGKLQTTIPGFPGPVQALAALDATTLAVGTPTGVVRVALAATTAGAVVLPGDVRNMTASNDGGPFAVVGPAGARLWWPATNRVAVASDAPMACVCFDAANRRFLGGGADGTVRGWRLDGTVEPLVVPLAAGPILAVVPGSGGAVWVACADGAFAWTPGRDGRGGALPCRHKTLCDLAVLPDGRLFSAGGDGDFAVWDVSRDPRGRLLPGTAATRSVAFRDNDLIVARAAVGPLEVWDAARGVAKPATALAWPADARLLLAALSVDGDTLVAVAAGDARTAYLIDARSGAVKRRFPASAWPITAVGIDGTGTRLAVAESAAGSARVLVWDAAGSSPRPVLLDGPAPVVRLAFAADGRVAVGRTAVAGRPPPVLILDAAGATVALDGPPGGVRDLAFSPDGYRLAVVGASEAGAKVWTVATREPAVRLEADAPFDAVTFSPDGTRLATSAATGVGIWDASSGDELLRLPLLTPPAPGPAVLRFAPDGRRLVEARADGRIAVFDAPR